METIQKSLKKLKDYYIPDILNLLVSMKNNIQIKEKLNESIINFQDEKEIIYYIKIVSNNKNIIQDNSKSLLINFMKIIKAYHTSVNNIKNEFLLIQKTLIDRNEKQIVNLMTCNKTIDEKDSQENNNYLKLVEIDKIYKKYTRANLEGLDFKEYLTNPNNLLKEINNIYYAIKELI